MGYHRAGFDVVGVDVESQPNFPFHFVRADALTYPLDGFDAIHASPVCKLWSQVTRTAGPTNHADQITPLRPRLADAAVPYVIENVPNAPLLAPKILCGSMFDLDVRRHRAFETNWPLRDHDWPCRHRIWSRRYYPNRSDRKKNPHALASVIVVAGHGNDGPGGRVDDWRRAMGIDWMTRDELAQAIPPVYTEFIGRQLLMNLSPNDSSGT
jgi:DNA (cytosine-5)-methyltransferase 1